MLSVLSYNIHKGFQLGNQKFVLKGIKDAIENVGAELVFLQEVLGDHKKVDIQEWPTNSQFEYLADRIWPHFAYGKNSVYVDGHHGNAILSKYPISKWENIDISQNQFASRGILHAEINLEGLALHALCLHLDLLKSDRMGQVEQLCQRIEAHIPANAPIIIAGDFNDWTTSADQLLRETLRINEAFLQSTGKPARTFPAHLPALRLDRIYYRGLELKQADRMTGKPWKALSDHLAIWAQFERPRPKKR